MYHAACKVELQPFKRLYSQLTFFDFLTLAASRGVTDLYGRCDSARDRSRELSTNQIPLLLARSTSYLPIRYPHSREPRGVKPHFSTCTRAHMTRRYSRTDHREIDACGSYGGSCVTIFLLWEGTRCINGCCCWGSMSEAVIVPIVKVLRQ